MTSRRERNDFINFIIDATRDDDLAEKFFRKRTAGGIYNFFRREGYKDIPLNDCKDILKALKSMRGKGVSDTLKPVSTIPRRGY